MKKKLIDIQTTLTQSEISILDNLIERYRYHKRCWKHHKRELNKKNKKASSAFRVDGKSTLKLEQLINTFESKKMSLRNEIEKRKQILQKIHEHREEMSKIGHEIKKIVFHETDHVKEQQTDTDALVGLLTETAKVFGVTLNKTKTDAIMKLVSLLK